MEFGELLNDLETLVRETNGLWDEGWVTFNWRNYTFDHVQRVRRLALTLCRREGGDPVVTELAALLHDITKPYDGEYLLDAQGKRAVDARGLWMNVSRPPARHNHVTELYDQLGLTGQLHNESGAVIAEHLLRERGLPEPTRARVAEAIRDHLRPPEGAPIESQCLSDADSIDANIGLPAFVRNICINLHFFDQRKAPEAPPIAAVLAESPFGFLRPYITDNLPKWAAGKRRDFIAPLLTPSSRALSEARMDRLEQALALLAEEVAQEENGHRRCLDVVLHYMTHQDDPSIAAETAYLAKAWNGSETPAAVRAFIAHIQREMSGEI
jgi:putative nucleotidyltransferase with HDIG domain